MKSTRNMAFTILTTLLVAVSAAELRASSAAEGFLDDHPGCHGDGSGYTFSADCYEIFDCQATYPDFCSDAMIACADSCGECYGTIANFDCWGGEGSCYMECWCSCIQ